MRETQRPKPDPIEDYSVWQELTDLAKKRLDEAYHEWVVAAGNLAAQQARYPAIQALGWRHQSGMGSTPDDDLEDKAAAVRRARRRYALWSRAVALLCKEE